MNQNNKTVNKKWEVALSLLVFTLFVSQFIDSAMANTECRTIRNLEQRRNCATNHCARYTQEHQNRECVSQTMSRGNYAERMSPTANPNQSSECRTIRNLEQRRSCASNHCSRYTQPQQNRECVSHTMSRGNYAERMAPTANPNQSSECRTIPNLAERRTCATNHCSRYTQPQQNQTCIDHTMSRGNYAERMAPTANPNPGSNSEPAQTQTADGGGGGSGDGGGGGGSPSPETNPTAGGSADPAAATAAAQGADCQPGANGQQRICFNNPFPDAQAVGNHAALSGTEPFVNCNAQSSENWGRVTSDRNQNTSQIWSAAWSQLGNRTEQEVNAIADAAQGAQKLDQLVNEAKELYAQLMSCEAYRSLTAGGNFSSQQGGDRRRGGSSQRDKKSADGQITCKSCGEETQDYEPCVSAVNAYDAAMIGQVAFSGYQQIANMDNTMEAQSNLDPNNPTSGLSAQEQVIRGQGRLATQQAALDAGKTGLFFSMWSSIPDAETVENRCVNDAMRGRLRANDLAQDLEKFVAEARRAAAQAQQQLRNADTSQIASTARREIQRACRETLAGSCVINNSEAKDKMKQAAILAGVEAFVNMGKAALLNRQANRLAGLIDEVDNFNPESLDYNPEDYFGSQCELNPMAEGCDNFVSERSFGFGDGEPIQIHGLTQATTFDRGDGDLNNGDDNAVIPSNASREDVPNPVGAFDPGSKGPTGFVGNTPGAADVKEGGGNLAGGGGGGGVGSAGSPPGGPGGGAGAGAPQMARPTSGTTANGYDGGTGSIRLGGGYGAQGSRGPAAEVENPFGDLFGGKDPQGALDFRDPASEGDIASKDASIFSIITNRYGIVQQSDRLLEYERD